MQNIHAIGYISQKILGLSLLTITCSPGQDFLSGQLKCLVVGDRFLITKSIKNVNQHFLAMFQWFSTITESFQAGF